MASIWAKEFGSVAWDGVSGNPLDPKEVAKARAVEMDYFGKMKGYTRVPRSHQVETGGTNIGVRWLDVNKGDGRVTPQSSHSFRHWSR